MTYAIDNLACVVTVFDEEGEIPVDYVLKWPDGFEAFVCKIENDTLDSISIGRYPTLGEAVSIIHKWNALNRYRNGNPFDFNPPRAN
jgi:hypothetical protein